MDSSFTARLALLAVWLAAMPLSAASAQMVITYHADEDHPGGTSDTQAHDTQAWTPGTSLAVSPFALSFTTLEDAQAYWDMAARAYALPVPDARAVAKAFLSERLHVDGDAYVVAHFASPRMRVLGQPDHSMTLTDALMEAFPDHSRHAFFAALSDGIGSLNAGGQASPGAYALFRGLVQSNNIRECFADIGRFLWSRTGPGYLYNTFLAKGNVIETVREDARALDEAFGVFAAGDFKTATALQVSAIVKTFQEETTFGELPYVKRLDSELDTYWNTVRAEWPVIARYRFVEQARRARMTGTLTPQAYERVMRRGAPHVPLEGAITLAQLRDGLPPAGVATARRFDINGYFATNLVRFIDSDGSEVLYIPGAQQPFVTFSSEHDLRQWVLAQARHPATMDALLSHFSAYDAQDGVFWTGVRHALDNLAAGRWRADAAAIDHAEAIIVGDLFEDMRAQTEKRRRDDARTMAATAWEGWRTTINRTASLLGPLGYAPPLAIPIQAGMGLLTFGTGIDQGIRGRTAQARRSGVEQAVMTVVTNVPLAAAFDRMRGTAAASAEDGATSADDAGLAHVVPPRRINGRIGYLLGPVKPPRILPTLRENVVYPRLDPISHADRPLSSRQMETTLTDAGYMVQAVPASHPDRVLAVIALKKEEIAARQADLAGVSDRALTPNALGYMATTDQSLVYRVDSRTPQQLLDRGGFGPSRNFVDVDPLIAGGATIGSDSLGASTDILEQWARDPVNRHLGAFHQYVVRTHGREVASVSDNAIPGADAAMSEAHFPSDIRPDDIYIVDSSDPAYAKAISEIIESDHVSTPYGVPLEAFTEYLAGRLDIAAPNRFSEHRLDAHMLSVPADPATDPAGASADTSGPYAAHR